MDKQNMKTVNQDIKNSFQTQNGKDFVFNVKSGFVAFQGHFPGQPLLPGIVQIEIVLFCIKKLLNDETVNIAEILKVKFIKPILPETKITVSLETADNLCKAVIKDDKEVYSQIQLKTGAQLQPQQ
jgi:3-hydroxymyristoyl/3-hydroxydecanoyl-(acyl carrier protein) dehydratase